MTWGEAPESVTVSYVPVPREPVPNVFMVDGLVLADCDCEGDWVAPGGEHYTHCRAYGMTRQEEIAWRTSPDN